MKKTFLFFLFLFLLLLRTIAQNNYPPVYEIKEDTAFEQVLNHKYWQILEDKEGKWTIEDVNQPLISYRFHDSSDRSVKIDTTVHVYWFRYHLKNMTIQEAGISIDCRSDQVDIFVLKTAGKWAHFATGYSYPWNKKDGLKNGNYIPFTLRPGEELFVFQRIINNMQGLPKEFEIGFVNTGIATQMELAQYDSIFSKQLYSGKFYLGAIYFGIILFTALFNFFFFLIVREKYYLYFSSYLICVFLGDNPLFNGLLSTEHPLFAALINGASALFIFFFFQFLRHYFQTYRYTPKWDKLLFISSISTLYIAVLIGYASIRPDIMSNLYIQIPNYIVNVVSLLSVLFTIFYYIRKKSQANTLFLIAVLPYILYNVIGVIGYYISQMFDLHFRDIEAWLGRWGNLIVDFTIIWMVLFFSWILFRRYDEQKKEIAQQALDKERLAKDKEIERNQLIGNQKAELEKTVEERTAELKNSLDNLRLTQTQLIQSEKMASLGELTAGIAHEIQNPLNFVNNFSEVNRELIEELKEEAKAGNNKEVIAIAEDIDANEERISHHGQRADAIVKGMLQHSRTSSGKKEPTNMNALSDEYLRLAYHGFRAKDKSFNSLMITDFDQTVGNNNIIPQDIGRVLLNLYNNAFYAVSEKKKQHPEGYEPTVSVSTKKVNGFVEIRVKDNGTGIPQKVRDKIFQPFFTTKPTGQGTGLGLSLSYDIIKAHEGDIKLETKEGDFTEFVIQIPGG